MEQFAEDAQLLGELREHLQANGQLVSKVATGKEEAGAKFRDYFDYREPISAIPSHRGLALFRGRKEEILPLALKLPEELTEQRRGGTPAASAPFNSCERRIAAHFEIARPGASGGCLAVADRAVDLAGEARPGSSKASCSRRCASAPKKRPSAFSRKICTICCWPRRLGRAPPWVLIRACAPA